MGMRVLIVDDDDLYWELVRQAFARSEFLSEIELDRCDSGIEFIKRLTSDDVQPSLVLLDQRMPELDGTTVLSRMRENSLAPWMSVCLMTSSEEPELVEEALSRGARFCFSKPSSFSDLRIKLATIIAFFRELVMLPQAAL